MSDIGNCGEVKSSSSKSSEVIQIGKENYKSSVSVTSLILGKISYISRDIFNLKIQPFGQIRSLTFFSPIRSLIFFSLFQILQIFVDGSISVSQKEPSLIGSNQQIWL